MLFSCVRDRGGFNNNPNALQLKYAFRKILLHNAITSSDKANVMIFEENLSGSLFSFKTNRRQSRLSKMTNIDTLYGITDADILKLDQESLEKALKMLFHNDICGRKCAVLHCRIHIKIHSKIYRLQFMC